MMNIRFLTALFLLLGIYACSKDDDLESIAFFDPLSIDTLWYNETASAQSINLNASAEIEVEVPQGVESWCRAEITGTGKGQAITVSCLANEQVELRTATLLLKAAKTERKLTVVQYGVAPVIKVVKSDYLLSADSAILSVPVISNVNFDVQTGEPWVHYQGIVKGESSDTIKFGLSSSIWPRRSAEVLLKWENLSATVTITQVNADTIYQAQEGPVSTRVNIVGGEANYESPYGLFNKTYDRRTTTYLSGNIPISEHLEMTWYFEKAVVLNRMIFIPDEADGVDYALGKFYVDVREEGGSEFRELGLYDFKYSMQTSPLKFESQQKKIEAVRFRVLPPDNGATRWALGCQEVEFYGDEFDTGSIFTDELCTDLKEGVTYEQIMAIEDVFYRNLARHLYAGTYDKEFRVQEYLPYADPDIQKEDHVSRAWGFLDNVTGITTDENETLVIFVGDTRGETVGLYVADWENDKHPSPRQILPLTEGINLLNTHDKGFLYITYFTDQPQNKEPIKIHIASGKVNGYFDITKPGHDNAYWQNLLAKRAQYKYLDVKGKYCHLNFLAEDFLTYCPTDIESLISACDSVIYLEHELSGIYRYKERDYPNRMLCRYTTETGNFLAHASDYFTCYIPDAVKGILDVNALKQNSWAMAHELGHVHQHRNITWKEMTEVSNNVFSLYVQTAFGNTSRLYEDDVYRTAYEKLAVQGKPYNGANEPYNNYFTKLVPLWQLQLYFSKVLDRPDFYPDLYEAMRKQGELGNDKAKFLNFIELCCETGEQDLTEFFRFFGFLTPTSTNSSSEFYGLFTVTQEEIDRTVGHIASMSLAKPQPLQYLTDGNIQLFREKKAVEKGSVQLNGNTLRLNGWQNAVAYEVRKAGKLIQIEQKDEFTLQETGADITVQAIAADGSRLDVDFRN